MPGRFAGATAPVNRLVFVQDCHFDRKFLKIMNVWEPFFTFIVPKKRQLEFYLSHSILFGCKNIFTV